MNSMYGQSLASGYAGQTSDPVQLLIPRQESYSRFWAIPVVGIVAKYIILIPHFIVLAVLGLVVYVLQLVTWIPVLFTGQYPPGLHEFCSGVLGWGTRVSAYMYGLSDTYPSFSLTAAPQESQLMIQRAEQSKRLWAVPVIGIGIKYIILIPHLVVLYVLGIIVMLFQLVTWIPVLFTGQYPEWARNLVAGYVRWAVRVYAYLLGLTDSYPPFQLGD